jgi:hypothetical protein
MRLDYQTPLQIITIYIIYKDLHTPHSRMCIMKCLGNFLEENVKVDKTRCGHQLLLQNTKHEILSRSSTRGGKIHGCKGRGCHLKSHSESANHWPLSTQDHRSVLYPQGVCPLRTPSSPTDRLSEASILCRRKWNMYM